MIQASEIAIIAAGLDEVARYNLSHCLQQRNLEAKFLQEQRPFNYFPYHQEYFNSTVLTL